MSKNTIVLPNLKNQSKLLLTIDWLTLNVNDNFTRLEFPENNVLTVGSFMLEYIPDVKTRHFNKYFKLWDKSEVVAVITSSSNSKKMLDGRAHIKIENHIFYNGELENLLSRIVNNFSLQSVTISRLDMALDGVFLHKFLNKYLYGKNCKHSNLDIGRVNDLDNITPLGFNRSDIKSNSFSNFVIGSWGNKSLGKARSEKFARYYNKSKELADTQKKEYISDYYKNNGFDMSKDIFRFEIQVSASWLKKISVGVDTDNETPIVFGYQDLTNLDALKSLFKTALYRFFEFYIKDNKRVDRCTRIDMFPEIDKSVFAKIVNVVKDKVRTIKIMVNRLVKDVLLGSFKNADDSEKTNIRTTVAQLIERYHIFTWFKNTFPYQIGEISRTAKLKGIKIDDEYKQYALWT